MCEGSSSEINVDIDALPRSVDLVRGPDGAAAFTYLDERLLPYEERFETTSDWRVIVDAIKTLAVRGAPAIGILLYTTIGFHSVMFLDFFGALCAVAGLMLAKIPNVRDEEAANQHVLANLRDGWRALTAKRGLLMVMAAVTLGTMIFSPMSAVYPLMTYSHFGGDGFMASIAEATWGIGMIVGSGIIMAWGGGKRLALLMAVACILTGIITIACGLLPRDAFPAFAVLCGLMAIPCSWFNAPTMTLAQRNVPEEKLGRVMGLMTAGFGLASPVGVALGGALAEGIGVAPFFVVDGLLCIILGAAMYLPREIRALDHDQSRS